MGVKGLELSSARVNSSTSLSVCLCGV